jgi:hypothetical protein
VTGQFGAVSDLMARLLRSYLGDCEPDWHEWMKVTGRAPDRRTYRGLLARDLLEEVPVPADEVRPRWTWRRYRLTEEGRRWLARGEGSSG